MQGQRRGDSQEWVVPWHRNQGILQEGLHMVDIHIQGHPDREHALEAPLPSRQGTRARFVAFRPRRRVLRLARVHILNLRTFKVAHIDTS
jgi:hypothetical protein